ncbi:MAG: ABC transporter permease [Oscillospiraceae bacterium]|nr:ABC transporter permease [Oscillospiraceae bacterium]
MRSFFAIFTASFKYCWRSPVNVAVLTIFPIVIIFVLGNALSGYMSPDYDFETIAVAATAERDSELGAFLLGDEVGQFIAVQFTDENLALELLDSGEVSIIISENNGNVVVTRPQVAGLEAAIAASVIDSYVQINAAMQIATANLDNMAELAELLQIINADLSIEQAPLGNRVPGALDYYAVTMLVMILLFAGLNGLELFRKNIFSTTGERLLIAPVSKPVLIGGVLASATVSSYLQGMATFLFSWLVYGVYWGERIPLVLLTLFGVTLFSQALAIFVLLILGNANLAMGVMQAVIWTMTFVAGGYVKIDFGAAEKVFQFSPNSLAHTVIFGAVYGGNETKMAADLTLLFVYAAICFVGAFILGRRRLA